MFITEVLMQNYIYSSIAGVALVVHLIINWRQLFGGSNFKSRAGAPEFRMFLVSLTFFFAADVLWGIFFDLKQPRPFYVCTIFFFLTMAVSIFAWTRCVAAYLEMSEWPRRCLLWTGRGLLAFFIGALIVNSRTDCFFRIDGQCVYEAGPLRQLALMLLVAFNAVSAGLTLVKLRHTRGALRRRYKMVFAFVVTMTTAILLQLEEPFLPIYSLGCLFGCCLLHVFVIEDERAEMRQKEVQLEAERSANRAKSLFFSSVSHDIRTPLNAIIGFSELLEAGVPDEKERTRCISSICSSGKMLARLVEDILDLSKLEIGKLEIIREPTDVPALVREVIAASECARARKSLMLRTEICEMPQVSVDPYRLRQILFNLLSNAYKYTERGTITVRVGWQDGTLTLSVSDTGKGISREDLSRILLPFVQLADRNHRDGTGLGLPICQKLVTLMGGELSIDSEVGKGSTFTITFHDIKTADRPIAQAHSGEHPEHAIRKIRRPDRVLIVDDSPVNRAVLKALLAKLGVTDVAAAGNGREALAILRENADFDVVFSDLWMPVMDGQKLIESIRADAKLAHLPVYLITADVEAYGQSGPNEFNDILLKPITLDKLQVLFA